MPPECIALEAKFDAWLNLSHREKARVFVMVRTNAIATVPEAHQQNVIPSSTHIQWDLHSPFRLNQIGDSSLTSANIANPTQRAGCAYKANQKNLSHPKASISHGLTTHSLTHSPHRHLPYPSTPPFSQITDIISHTHIHTSYP